MVQRQNMQKPMLHNVMRTHNYNITQLAVEQKTKANARRPSQKARKATRTCIYRFTNRLLRDGFALNLFPKA